MRDTNTPVVGTRLDQDILKAQAQLAELEAKKAKRDREENGLTEAQKLAIRLHEALCASNHTDMCGWYYDDMTKPTTWTNTYGAHKRYLQKAEAALKVADFETILNITLAIKGY